MFDLVNTFALQGGNFVLMSSVFCLKHVYITVLFNSALTGSAEYRPVVAFEVRPVCGALIRL